MKVADRTSKGVREVLMKNVALGLVIVIAVGLLGFCSCAKPAASEPYEVVVDSVMEYIKQNHPDAAPLIKDTMSWTLEPPVVKHGHSVSTYTGDGWTVTIGHTITPEAAQLGVTAAYNGDEIVWTGTVKELITETSYAKK